jgi:selenocysteine-specific elongation factor
MRRALRPSPCVDLAGAQRVAWWPCHARAVRVIATAGHVDHGKSALVRALTGRDPDRLPEERRRGMTIELGFAWTELDGVGTVAFVDVPGHERLVPTMLAGAGPAGVALLVVAADEGWMPQSAEHLAILSHLGVAGAVVALTKADLVDADTLEVATALVEEQLAGTPLGGAPLVAVSATTGQGLDMLRSALAAVLTSVPLPAEEGRPRLWIDRAFTIRGAGTVVTGTLRGGALAVGDRLRTVPGGAEVRVRGLQALEHPVERAEPGWRVAANLVGVDVADVARGTAVVASGAWRAADAVDLWCTPGAGDVVGRRGAWTLHAGTAAVAARLLPVAGADLRAPGPVRAELASPLPLAVGDRVVLRESGHAGTAGGAVVLDPVPPPRPRGRAARVEAVEALTALATEVLDGSSPGQRLAALVARHGGLPLDVAVPAAGATAADVDVAPVVRVAGVLLPVDRARVLQALVVQAVVGVHQRRPALAAVDRADARRLAEAAGAPAGLAGALLDRLVADGRLEAVPGGVRIPGHEARLSVSQQSARTELLAALDAAGLEGLTAVEAAEAVAQDADLLDALLRDEQVLRLADDRLLAPAVVDRAVALLRAHERQAGPFTASEAREVLGGSRRVVIPLLELLDARGVTARDGDRRHLR